MKPDGYPLPWNDLRDEPYFQINWRWCRTVDCWADWQAGKPMARLIPAIDSILARHAFF